MKDHSKASLVFSLLCVALLAATFFVPWLHYEQSSGRNTSEEGPYGEHKMVEYHNATVGLLETNGELIPDDERLLPILMGLVIGGGALALLAACGDIPGIARIFPRKVTLALQILSFATIAAVLIVGWFYLPRNYGSYGVTQAFTYFLEEPDGYTRTHIGLGLIMAGLAWLALPIAWIFKFGAGADELVSMEGYRA